MPVGLTDNILAQIAEMRAMNRQPTKLSIDPDSFDCLIDELGAGTLLYPMPVDSSLRIFGLQVEICAEPNFEVV